jgi:hypothetical protein
MRGDGCTVVDVDVVDAEPPAPDESFFVVRNVTDVPLVVVDDDAAILLSFLLDELLDSADVDVDVVVVAFNVAFDDEPFVDEAPLADAPRFVAPITTPDDDEDHDHAAGIRQRR